MLICNGNYQSLSFAMVKKYGFGFLAIQHLSFLFGESQSEQC
jgi:hypothetical protein